jgi:carbamate kinase
MLALGGNAMTNADGRARPEDQIAAAEVAMGAVAELLAHDAEVVALKGDSYRLKDRDLGRVPASSTEEP